MPEHTRRQERMQAIQHAVGNAPPGLQGYLEKLGGGGNWGSAESRSPTSSAMDPSAAQAEHSAVQKVDLGRAGS